MSVKSIYERGGKVPDIEDDTPPKAAMQPKDELADAEAFAARSLKRRTLDKELNESKTLSPTPTAIMPQTQTDLVPILKGYSDMMSTSIETLGKFYQTQSQGGNTPHKDPDELNFMKFLIDRFQTIEARLNASPPDPLATLVSTNQQLSALFDQWKKREGVPQSIPVGMGDMNLLLQLEDIKLKNSREERHFQAEMEDWRSKREQVQRQWESEHELRVMQFNEDRLSRRKAGDIFEDLMGAVADGIDKQPAGGQQEESAPVSAQAGMQTNIKSFRCSACKNVVNVPSPDTVSITCQNCGAEYDLKGEGA
mgnify:CR=1 FL=1